ncbi:MAG: hypothetical protein DMF63_15395 [Acidobacteria bacterium]|nr:MAG: hypothetical protein DMF63_15395 [Acidobacteriota bacterium]
MLLVIACACVVAAGFFFAARQHFNSMDYSIKNSKLREQIQNLETEKRRLILAREVAVSPLAIRKAANSLGLRQNAEVAAIQVASKESTVKSEVGTPTLTKRSDTKSPETKTVVKTVMAAPVQTKPAGDVRNRIADTGKEKKDKTEVAALLKLR